MARGPPQVDRVVGDRKPGVEDMRALRFMGRVIAESQRMYPQVLGCRARGEGGSSPGRGRSCLGCAAGTLALRRTAVATAAGQAPARLGALAAVRAALTGAPLSVSASAAPKHACLTTPCPQPPVLIRRSLEPDTLGGFEISEGQDIFIATWNMHR